MDISIIIVNWNTRELLRNCLSALAETVRGLSLEVIVVDNASADGSVAMLRESFPAVKVIENPENRGFGAANNQALRVMNGRYALLLNSDAILCKQAVERLFAFMEAHPEAAMACGQLLNADGSRQNSIANFPNLFTLLMNTSLLEYLWPAKFPGKRYNVNVPMEVDSCIGACLMVRKQAIDAVGMFDERYFFFFEETDWALAMRKADWKSFYIPEAQIYHLQGQSIGGNIRSRVEFYRSRYQFFRKWKSRPVYLLFRLVISVRLFINWVLTTCGTLLTLGLNRELRDKFVVYGKLLAMHLTGVL
ncbi:MAG: glycosyltransferase family 2 protein [Syntrophales bacterium]